MAAGGVEGLFTKRSVMLMSSRETKWASRVLVEACKGEGGGQAGGV